MTTRDQVTVLLNQAGDGGPAVLARLMPLVYGELRQIARHHRLSWRDARTPSTRSLVHEAYLKLVDQTHVEWQNRAQFFAIASRAMRSILVDNARRFARQKRGGGAREVPFDEHLLVSEQQGDLLLALDDALDQLRADDAELGDIVECRFFGGLTIDETAEALRLSPATVKRRWTFARAWLHAELARP